MKFMLTFNWSPDAQMRADGIERFQKTGAVTPDGVKLLGRWTRVDLSGGFVLLETDDAAKLVEFSYRWNDLMDLEIVPVLEDRELGDALRSAMK
jgi:hypothetical protein